MPRHSHLVQINFKNVEWKNGEVIVFVFLIKSLFIAIALKIMRTPNHFSISLRPELELDVTITLIQKRLLMLSNHLKVDTTLSQIHHSTSTSNQSHSDFPIAALFSAGSHKIPFLCQIEQLMCSAASYRWILSTILVSRNICSQSYRIQETVLLAVKFSNCCVLQICGCDLFVQNINNHNHAYLWFNHYCYQHETQRR